MAHLRIQRYLQVAAATFHFYSIFGFYFIGPMFALWIIIFTRCWYLALIYLMWIWMIDNHIQERGGRPLKFLRKLRVFHYAKEYYPIALKTVPAFILDPRRNYMFCSFPHGIFAISTLLGLGTNACGIDDLIPNHSIRILTINSNFKIPIYRDYVLSFGICSASATSISFLLNRPEGGNIASLVIGGAAESLYTKPGKYTVVLKERKGFIKLALKCGSPLVPVFAFGEVDICSLLGSSEGSPLRRFQEWCKSKVGAFPVIINGPFSKPINIIVGEPIEVKKNLDPSSEEVDALHNEFIKHLMELFEEHKHDYIDDAENTTLTIV